MVQGAPNLLGLLMANIQQRIGFLAREEVAGQAAQTGQMLPPEAMEGMVAARCRIVTADYSLSFAPQQQDPLVGIRQAEVQLQAQDQQRKMAKDQVDAMLEQARLDQQLEILLDSVWQQQWILLKNATPLTASASKRKKISLSCVR